MSFAVYGKKSSLILNGSTVTPTECKMKNGMVVSRKVLVTTCEEAEAIMVKQSLYKVNLPNFSWHECACTIATFSSQFEGERLRLYNKQLVM